jgi:hypothetical protein
MHAAMLCLQACELAAAAAINHESYSPLQDDLLPRPPTHPLQAYSIHEAYDEDSMSNDIALLKLETNAAQPPVRVGPPGVKIPKKVTTMGWGTNANKQTPNWLQ